jgi:hypothetical protein
LYVCIHFCIFVYNIHIAYLYIFTQRVHRATVGAKGLYTSILIYNIHLYILFFQRISRYNIHLHILYTLYLRRCESVRTII